MAFAADVITCLKIVGVCVSRFCVRVGGRAEGNTRSERGREQARRAMPGLSVVL